jgi:hypothetical protein
MKTLADLRTMVLAELAGALEAPGMYACCPPDQASLFVHRLGLLCFLDGRDEDLAAERQRLIRLGVHYPPNHVGGVNDALRLILPDIDQFECEAASVYAEIAWRLGYLALERTLLPEQYTQLVTFIAEGWDRRDWTLAQITNLFGPPSFVVGSDYVCCYATDDRTQPWVCFDLPWRTGDWIRSVRHSIPSLDEGLRLTPHGRKQSRRAEAQPAFELGPEWRRVHLHVVREEEDQEDD